jgi:ArsR family transcriptional regulator, arsenate/arsenite/antimonite-responsive transcriptional repressor
MKPKGNPLDIPRLSGVFKLLAEPNRLRILLNLGLECRPVSAIIAGTGLSQTNVSFHLRALREAGLVKAEKHGPFVFYCLPDPQLLEYIEGLAGWLEGRMEGPAEDEAFVPKSAAGG